MFPPKNVLTICFAHAAYQMKASFDALDTGIDSFEVRDRAEFERRAPEADVIVVSGMWHNGLLPLATKLRFIQSIGSGTDQFDKDQLAARNIRLASAAGVNARAVSEHAMSLILALSRRLPEARDNQARRVWRGMIGDVAQREDELTGKTVLIIGLGRIGGRLAQLAKAFDMNVIGFRRDPAGGKGAADSVHTLGELHQFLPQADFVVLTCPLTPETREVIDAKALAAMPAVRLSGEYRPRRLRRRTATDRGSGPAPHRRRRTGLHRRGTTAAGIAAVGHAACVHHPAHRRRDAEIRRQCQRNPAGEPQPAMARRGYAVQPGRLSRCPLRESG